MAPLTVEESATLFDLLRKAELVSIDIVFDGPPGPTSGRFIEVELADTKAGIKVGEWADDGPLTRLRINPAELVSSLPLIGRTL